MSKVEIRIKEMPNDDLVDVALGLRRQIQRMDRGLMVESLRRREVIGALQDRLLRE